jgi:serine/threonine protein kinase
VAPLFPRAPDPPTEYKLVAKKGEGTFSEVLKAQCIKNGKQVAIKCMKNHFDSLDQARPRRRGTHARAHAHVCTPRPRGLARQTHTPRPRRGARAAQRLPCA